MENKILLIIISAKVSYPPRSFWLTTHYIHIPCDIDYVQSHVESMKSDISGFVAQVFLNEETQLMPRKCQIDAFPTIYTPKSNDSCASFVTYYCLMSFAPDTHQKYIWSHAKCDGLSHFFTLTHSSCSKFLPLKRAVGNIFKFMFDLD